MQAITWKIGWTKQTILPCFICMYHLFSFEEKLFPAIEVAKATSHNYVLFKTDDSLLYLNAVVVWSIAFSIHGTVA